MRKVKLLINGGLSVLALVSVASAETAGKVYYKDGVNFEFGNELDLKVNALIQPRYDYTDIDGGPDSSSFELRRTRLIISGNMVDKQFSYLVQEEVGSEALDSWVQWNGDGVNARLGRYKAPFGRQELISDGKQMFTEHSIASDFIVPSRDTGAMLHGGLGDAGHWYAGVFNGNSAGEDRSTGGVDPRLSAVTSVDYSLGDYGSRGHEGDFRSNGAFAATMGAGLLYGEGTGPFVIDDEGDFDQLRLTADLGVRANGMDAQAEVFYATADYDDLGGDAGERDDVGFYLQATQVVDKWGFGARYSLITPDDDITGIDDISEYSFVVNYFVNGHAVKIQNNITWIDGSTEGGEDTTDFQYTLQLTGTV